MERTYTRRNFAMLIVGAVASVAVDLPVAAEDEPQEDDDEDP